MRSFEVGGHKTRRKIIFGVVKMLGCEKDSGSNLILAVVVVGCHAMQIKSPKRRKCVNLRPASRVDSASMSPRCQPALSLEPREDPSDDLVLQPAGAKIRGSQAPVGDYSPTCTFTFAFTNPYSYPSLGPAYALSPQPISSILPHPLLLARGLAGAIERARQLVIPTAAPITTLDS